MKRTRTSRGVLIEHGEWYEAMKESLEHPEHLHQASSEQLNHRYYHTIQDKYEQLIQHHRDIMAHHQLLMEHHQLVHALFIQVQDAQLPRQEKQHALDTYHQELLRHHQMVEDHTRLLYEHSSLLAAIQVQRTHHREGHES